MSLNDLRQNKDSLKRKKEELEKKAEENPGLLIDIEIALLRQSCEFLEELEKNMIRLSEIT